MLMKFVLKNPCQQQCIFSVAPCQRSYACPIAQRLQTHLGSLGRTVFRDNRIDGICPENPCQQLCFSVRRSSPQAISHGFPSVHPIIASVSLLLNGALPELFPTVSLPSTPSSFPYRSFPTELSPSLFPTVSLPSTLSSFPYRSFPPELSPCYFPRFPFRPPCRHSRIAPSSFQGFPSSSLHRSFRTELPPCYFPRFPLRPPNHRFRIAPSQRSSPRAISHGFPSVHPVVTPVSLLPTGALPRLFPGFPLVVSASQLPYGAPPMLFPTVSPPSTQSSLPYTLLPNGALPELFPNVSKLLPTVSLLSTSRRFRFAPSHRSSPHANFHGFPPVHPLVASASLLPTRALPMLISTVSAPSTLSSLPHRSFPPELSPSYFPRFPFRPPCRHSRIAPSHRSSPHANFHGSPPVHPLVASASLLPTGALPKLFPTVSSFHPLVASVSLLPTGALPKLFPTVSPRPPSRRFRIATSPRSSLHAISHGFPSVHPLVASILLLPHGTLPKLFPTVSSPSTQSLLPSVPSQQNSPQAISHGFPSVHPIVASIRSLPTKLSPSYFPRFPLRPPSRIAPSRQSD